MGTESALPPIQTRAVLTDTLKISAGFQNMIGSRRSIENPLHRALDVGFGYDQSGTRKENAPQNTTAIRRAVINYDKKVKAPRESIKDTRKKIGWSNVPRRETLSGQEFFMRRPCASRSLDCNVLKEAL